MKGFFRHFLLIAALLSTAPLASSDSSASTACGSECLAIKQTFVNGQKNFSDAFGRYINLTTTLKAAGYNIKRVFVQRENFRADYRTCQPRKDDVVCSFPAFNIFYGRKPDVTSGELLKFKIRALGEHKVTGESKIIRDSFSVRYFPNKSKAAIKTIHAKEGMVFVKYDPGNAQIEAPSNITIPLNGKVVDAKSKQPIENAKVRIFPIIASEKRAKLKTLYTDSDGLFEIESSAPYSFSLYIEAPGHKPYSTGILSQVKNVEIQLASQTPSK